MIYSTDRVTTAHNSCLESKAVTCLEEMLLVRKRLHAFRSGHYVACLLFHNERVLKVKYLRHLILIKGILPHMQSYLKEVEDKHVQFKLAGT